MINQAFLGIVLAFLTPAQTTPSSTCYETVKQVVYEHPKPAYPKDVRQYTYVKKTVEKTVCKMAVASACCVGVKPGA